MIFCSFCLSWKYWKQITTLDWTCRWNNIWRSGRIHDDVIKWKHFPRYWPFEGWVPRSPANSPHKGQWRGALMFSLICAWISGWVNNREADDLKIHRDRCGVTLMYSKLMSTPNKNAWCAVQIFKKVTGHNGHKPKRPQTERPQTGTATIQKGHRPKRAQTGKATNRNGHNSCHLQQESNTDLWCLTPTNDGRPRATCHYMNQWCLFFWSSFLLITCWNMGQSTISQHWLIWWLGVEQATRHYLNQ